MSNANFFPLFFNNVDINSIFFSNFSMMLCFFLLGCFVLFFLFYKKFYFLVPLTISNSFFFISPMSTDYKLSFTVEDFDFLLVLSKFFNVIDFFYILFIILTLVFLQSFLLKDVLLLVLLLDLSLSILSVIFMLCGLFYQDMICSIFFFLLLSLAACETALALGFLVSFSRRHVILTTSSLKFLAS